jgi:hypothetical protein
MLSTLHEGLGNAATLFCLILAGWGFLRYARGEGVDGSYLGAVVIGEGLLLLQALAGVLLLGGGARPERAGVHILYGIVAIISFPAFYAFTRGRDSRQEMQLWSLLALFVFGCILRARMVVGG